MISLIAAIGRNYELGRNNQLVFHIKEDMQFFRHTTMGHSVIMGRKTFESIGRSLPNRTNYVVTHHPELLPDDVEPVSDLRELLKSWQDTEEELFVIGGATIYAIALSYAKYLYLTEVDATTQDADAFFPVFDRSQYSREIIKKGKDHDLTFAIVKYTKN